MDFQKTLMQYLAAVYPAFYVTTHEEARAEADIRSVARKLKDDDGNPRPVRTWTMTKGWVDERDQPVAPAKDAKAAIEAVLSFPDDTICVLKDFHSHINAPLVVRMLRDVLPALKRKAKPLIFLSPVATIPLELEKEITLVEYTLPDRDALGLIFDEIHKASEGALGKPVPVPDKIALLEAARGMTAAEAENGFALAWGVCGGFGDEAVKIVLREKAQVLKKAQLVTWVETKAEDVKIGGLTRLKAWIDGIAPVFHHPDKAEAFGLRPEDFPRSVLLVGPPGTGKSTVAKALALLLKIGCIQSDFGRLMGGVVGQPEGNARRRNELAEAMAPVVDWWDEVEKALAGVKGSDQNPWEARMAASQLTWMEEHRSKILIVATANNPDKMPPELVSRFQKVFLVDLPNAQERAEILDIHCKLRGMTFTPAELAACAIVTDGFSGRELRNGVQAAMQAGFASGLGSSKNVPVSTLKASLATITPVSQSRKAEIDRMRAWAKEQNIECANNPETDGANGAPVRKMSRR